MSINLLLGSAVSALQSNQTALGITANNIANVNTPDYARREVHFGTQQAGDLLSGVQVTEIRRIVDEFLAKEVLSTNSSSQYYETQANYHERLQSFIGSPDDERSLAGRLTTLMAQFNEVSIDPTSLPRRADLLSDLTQLTDTISGLAQDIQALRTDADRQFQENIARVNDLTAQIYDLNSKIQSSTLAGSDPSGLEDQRDTALKELSGLLDISVIRDETGRVNVATSSGISLVGTIRYELQYASTGVASSQTVFPEVTVHRVGPDGSLDPNGQDFNQHLTGGKLGALFDLRNTDLPEIAKELGTLSSTLIDAVNAVHNDNISLPAPSSLTGVNTGLMGTDAHNFTGRTTLAVVDDTGALVRRIDVDFGAGTYSVDGGGAVAFGGTIADVVGALNAGLGGLGSVSFVDGTLSLTTSSAAQGIGFLQDATDPSSRAGRGFAHFFGLNNLLGADAPSSFETGLNLADAHGFTGGPAELILRSSSGQILKEVSFTPSGTTVGDILASLNNSVTGFGAYGTFGLSSDGEMTFVPNGANADAVLISRGDATTRGTTGTSFTAFFGLGERFQMEQALGAGVNETVVNDLRFLSLAKLDITSTTAVGDIVVTESDSRGAIALNNIQNQTYQIPAAGGLVAMNVSLGEYTSSFLADTGQRASQVNAFAKNNQALFTEVEARQANQRGVSLDEELSNMMIYQQAYNAGARLVTTAKEVYDMLLSIV